MNELAKQDAFNEIVETFKYLTLMREKYNIHTPIKTEIELINLLLHIFDIYKPNETLRFTLLNGEGVLIKENTKGYDSKNHIDSTTIDTLNVQLWILDRNIEEYITKCSMNEVYTLLKNMFT